MQNKGKDPAFLFYPANFLIEVADLDFHERGVYVTMLSIQHQKGFITKKMMQLQCGGIPTEDVLSKFKLHDNGHYINSGIEEDRRLRRLHSEKQSANSRIRWDKYKESSKELSIKTECDRIANAMPLKTITITKNKAKAKAETETVEIYPTFEDFWDLYDKKSGSRRKTEAKFKGLPHKIKMEIIDHLDQYIPSTPDKQFRKDPITYLNNEGWEQEIIKQNQNESRTNNGTEYKNLERLLANTESLYEGN